MQPTEITPTRTEPHDLDASVAAVVLPVCDRLGLRSYLKGQHYYAILLDMANLDAHGANEAELMAYGLALIEWAKTLKSSHPTDERVSARMLLEADTREDKVRGILAIDGESASTLEQHAQDLEAQAFTSIAHARIQRRKARRIRTMRTVARERLGIGA